MPDQIVIVPSVPSVINVEPGTPGPSGVVNVASPIINTGTSTSAVIGIDQTAIQITELQVTNLISDLAAKETITGAQNKANAAQAAAIATASADATSKANAAESSAIAYATSGLSTKAPLNNPTFTGTVSGVTKSMVGLGNVDNTSDANKPISSATQTVLDLKAPINNPSFTGTVSGVSKSMVGLSNVDNTSDANKPISTATQTALDLKAPKASPTFTGTITGVDLNLTGNFTINGQATTINTTNLEVTDSIIYLSSNQYDTDILDIGIYGAYGDSNPGHYHSGLVRDHTDKVWKLFSGGTEPTDSIVNFTGITYDTLKIGGLTISGLGSGYVKSSSGSISSSSSIPQADVSGLVSDLSNKVSTSDSRLTDTRIPTDGSVTDAKITSGGLSPSKITGTAIVEGDGRLTDARTPLSHVHGYIQNDGTITQTVAKGSNVKVLITDTANNKIGVLGTASLPGSQFLRGDGSWVAPPNLVTDSKKTGAGSGTGSIISVNHQLGNLVIAQLFDLNGNLVDVDVQTTSDNNGTTTFTFANSVTLSNYTYVIIG